MSVFAFFAFDKTLGGVMKKLLCPLFFALSFTANAQQMNPYRVIFPKALELEGKTMVQVDKVKLKVKDGSWVEKKRKNRRFACNVSIELQGRDLATKNTKIGEHYYGTMDLDCTRGVEHFKTAFNRVLFLGIRNCVQSETVFDQDYCNLDVIAFRKERDVTIENGDLILQNNKHKEFFQISSTSAQNVISGNSLVPDGLQLATIDSFQVLKISLGKTAQEFFIQKPDANSNLAKGQNVYLTSNSDVLIEDQKLRTDIDSSYNNILDKLKNLPSGQLGVVAFENQLPSILMEFARDLKKLLTMITPTEFFQAEKKLISLEKQIITIANGFKPSITNRNEFRTNYASASDEYNRYSTYLLNPLQFTRIDNQIDAKIYRLEYHFEEKNVFSGDSMAFDDFIAGSCAANLAKYFSSLVNSNVNIKNSFDKLTKLAGYQKVWIRINLDDTRQYVQGCNFNYTTYVMGVKKDGVTVWEGIGAQQTIMSKDETPKNLNEKTITDAASLLLIR